MSIETVPSASHPEMSGLTPETIEEINAIEASENTPERSGAATNVLAAANRIADFFDAREAARSTRTEARNAAKHTSDVNKAHIEALKEYRDFDHSDYVDHLAQLSDVEVKDDIVTTEQQQTYAQDALNHENRIEDRAEAIDQAKSKLKGFGRSALKLLRKTGKITAAAAVTGLGAGVVAGVATGRGIKKGYDATMDKGLQASAYVDKKVEAGYDLYDKVSNGTKLRVGRSIENNAQSLKNRAELAKFDLGQLTKEYSFSNAKQNIKDKAELFKGGIDELSLSVTEYRLVQTERAKHAIARKIARAKAFGERGVEKFNDTREAGKRRAKRIGHRAVTTLSVAHESGQLFVDKMKSLKDEESTYTK